MIDPRDLEFEFYPTPHTFTRWLFSEEFITGTVMECCVGAGDIIRAAAMPHRALDAVFGHIPQRSWITNDLDDRWQAEFHYGAEDRALWEEPSVKGRVDWTVTNPPFACAIPILDRALEYSRVGVAMHFRISINEVLKRGIQRTFLAQHPPTKILFLPRYAYTRSRTTGKFGSDNVAGCWMVWRRDATQQYIRYAPEWVIDEARAEHKARRLAEKALVSA